MVQAAFMLLGIISIPGLVLAFVYSWIALGMLCVFNILLVLAVWFIDRQLERS